MINTKKGIESVPGFSYAAVECGIRYKNRLDYCLVLADKPCNASGVFTTNAITAAPVTLCRSRINNQLRAILVNSTNANACTGEAGLANTERITRDMAERLGLSTDEIIMSSTGVIGHQLPVETMIGAHDKLIAGLGPENGPAFARAIMTTDTVPKNISTSFPTSRGEYMLAATAKGSGMIAPNMATLLAFFVTNAPLEKSTLDRLFKKTAVNTLNAITVDGDMSTNDTAVILSPVSVNPLTRDDDIASFEHALSELIHHTARLLVADGEGVTRMVSINVTGAASHDDARKVARSVSESLLVKTAFFGKDPNWGRIAAAAGYSGASVREQTLSIHYEKIPLLINGMPQDISPDLIKPILEKQEFTVTIDLGMGNGQATMLTSDISFDYVRINAEYTT